MSLNDACACALRDYRNRYDYPNAHVALAELNEADPPFADVELPFRFKDPNGPTDFSFDVALRGLLRSTAQMDVQRGLCSALYWGFFTHGPAFARGRVGFLIQPLQPGPLAIRHPGVVTCVQRAARLIDLGDCGGALASLAAISQFSQTPFASKLVAFLRPDLAGVYDNRIAEILSSPTTLPDAEIAQWLATTVNLDLLAGGVGQTAGLRIQYKYSAWCWFLQNSADELNSMGAALRWSDAQSGPRIWRAVDVERAIFAAGLQ